MRHRAQAATLLVIFGIPRPPALGRTLASLPPESPSTPLVRAQQPVKVGATLQHKRDSRISEREDCVRNPDSFSTDEDPTRVAAESAGCRRDSAPREDEKKAPMCCITPGTPRTW